MTVTTLSLRPTSPWRTPDAGTGRKVLRVTLLRMNAEQQPCSKACRRLLRQPWTLGVTLDRMSRGLCPGGNSSAMTCRLASPTTVLRTSWKPYEMSGIILTFQPKMSCAASLVASSCTLPKPAGFPVGIAAGMASSSSSPTTSASSITLREEELTTRPTPLPPRAVPAWSPETPPHPQLLLKTHPLPRLPLQGPLRSWHAPSPSRLPPLVGASGCLSSQSGAFGYLPGSFVTLQSPSTSHWPAPFPGLALLTFLPGLPCGTASQQKALQCFPGLSVSTAGLPRARGHGL